MCAKNLQSRLTLCDLDCSPPGSSVHGFSRQEYWSGLPFPPLEDLPNPGIEPMSHESSALAGRSLAQTGKPILEFRRSEIQNGSHPPKSRCWHYFLLTFGDFFFFFCLFQLAQALAPGCITQPHVSFSDSDTSFLLEGSLWLHWIHPDNNFGKTPF